MLASTAEIQMSKITLYTKHDHNGIIKKKGEVTITFNLNFGGLPAVLTFKKGNLYNIKVAFDNENLEVLDDSITSTLVANGVVPERIKTVVPTIEICGVFSKYFSSYNSKPTISDFENLHVDFISLTPRTEVKDLYVTQSILTTHKTYNVVAFPYSQENKVLICVNNKLYWHKNSDKAVKDNNTTVVTDIIYNVNNIGQITPVLCVEPIQLNDNNWTRIALPSYSSLTFHNICVGSVIVLTATRNIPKVSKVYNQCKSVPLTLCPFCKNVLLYIGDIPYCVNNKCYGRLHAHATTVLSKILGVPTLSAAKTTNILANLSSSAIADVLKLREDDLIKIPYIGKTLATRLSHRLETLNQLPVGDLAYISGLFLMRPDNFTNVSRKTLNHIFKVLEKNNISIFTSTRAKIINTLQSEVNLTVLQVFMSRLQEFKNFLDEINCKI